LKKIKRKMKYHILHLVKNKELRLSKYHLRKRQRSKLKRKK
jgi:hypothetical protein